jgi:hypothetical protein
MKINRFFKKQLKRFNAKNIMLEYNIGPNANWLDVASTMNVFDDVISDTTRIDHPDAAEEMWYEWSDDLEAVEDMARFMEAYRNKSNAQDVFNKIRSLGSRPVPEDMIEVLDNLYFDGENVLMYFKEENSALRQYLSDLITSDGEMLANYVARLDRLSKNNIPFNRINTYDLTETPELIKTALVKIWNYQLAVLENLYYVYMGMNSQTKDVKQPF